MRNRVRQYSWIIGRGTVSRAVWLLCYITFCREYFGRLKIITYYVRAKEWISLRFLFHKYLIIPGYAYSSKRGPLEFMNSFLKWSLQIFEVFVGPQFSRLMKSIHFFRSALSEGKEKKLTFLSGGFLSEFWQPKTLHVLTLTFT